MLFLTTPRKRLRQVHKVSVFIVGTCTMTPGIASMPMIDQDPYPDPTQGPGPDPTQGPHKHMS